MASNTGPTVQNVMLLSVYTESSFANDESGSLSSFTPIPFQEGSASFTLTRETHDPMQAVQHHHDYREEVLGKKSCSLSFTMPLAPTGTGAASAVAAVQGALGLLLSKTMGTETLGTGSTAASWASGKTGTVASSAGFGKGTAAGWINSSSVLEARPLSNVSGSTLTNKIAFSGTPATSDVIYSSATYSLDSDPTGSLQFAVRGLESQDDWLLMGCQLDSISLSLPLDGTIPTVQFTFKGATWLEGADSTGAANFTDISPATYSNFSPITGQSGRFLAQDITTQAYTGSTVNVSAVAFEPQIAYQAITSPSGTDGVLRWRLSRNSGPSIQGSFTTYYESDVWHAARDAKDDKLFLYQCGTAAGGTILIEAATCQITDVQRVDDSGIAGVSVTWKGRLDAGVTSPTTDVHRSPVRIHLL